MNTEEKRKALAKWILESDENILNEVEAVYKTHLKSEEKNKKIVAYTVGGKPLTKEEYIKRIEKAEKGKFISSEELRKKMLSW